MARVLRDLESEEVMAVALAVVALVEVVLAEVVLEGEGGVDLLAAAVAGPAGWKTDCSPGVEYCPNQRRR
ncbi:MAG TPA: hypothetical protein VH681_05785 [Nitrospiraceae bacterium]